MLERFATTIPGSAFSPALRRKGGEDRWRHASVGLLGYESSRSRIIAPDEIAPPSSYAGLVFGRPCFPVLQALDRLQDLAEETSGVTGEWKGFPNRSLFHVLASRVRAPDRTVPTSSLTG